MILRSMTFKVLICSMKMKLIIRKDYASGHRHLKFTEKGTKKKSVIVFMLSSRNPFTFLCCLQTIMVIVTVITGDSNWIIFTVYRKTFNYKSSYCLQDVNWNRRERVGENREWIRALALLSFSQFCSVLQKISQCCLVLFSFAQNCSFS